MNTVDWNLGADTSGSLPTGTVTFVLGDVVGSTAMWEARPDAAAQAIAALDGLVDKLVDAHDGAKPIEQGEGDSFVAAFARGTDAAAFAIALQHAIATADWAHDGRPALRLAIHTGETRLQDGLYRGETLNRCARIRALAHGGQILVSGPTAELVVDRLTGDTFLKDLGVHRLRDLSRPEHLRQLCAPQLRLDFPPLASLDRLPNNLPMQLTNFLGRDTEMAELTELLSTQRLVTLTGAGGSGKTRLALQVTASTLDQWADGSWLVDLAAVTDPQQVGRAVAEVLGVHEMPMQDVVSAVETWLRDRRLLLLVDNCEHLIGECAVIVSRLLAACPYLTVLATSREPLGITGEFTYGVPSLSLPNGDGVQCASVELFVARAVAVRPSFRLGADNADAVALICRRLDGLPLAIELAAARCRALSPHQIAGQLANRFSLLSGGTRNVLPRQRTLEASVAWSFDLLTDEERSLLRRLSVFSGSFSLEGAEAVGAFDLDDPWRVVDMLTGLVDKSLVQVDEQDESLRYRLLETVRHFAAEQLITAGESEATRDAHARFYRQVVDHIAPDLIGPFASERYAELDRDRTNVRNALAWLVHTDQGTGAIGLAAQLWRAWSRSPSADILEMLEHVLALAGGMPRDRAQIMVSCIMVAWMNGDLEAMTRHIDGLEEHARAYALHDFADHPNLMRGWRGMLIDDPETVPLLVNAGHALRERGDFYWSSDAFFGAATALEERADYVGAEAFFIESDADAARSNDPVAVARAVAFHAANKMQLGDLSGAQQMLDEAAARQRQVDDLSVGLFGGAFRAWIHVARGEYEAAIDLVSRTVEESQRAGLPISLGWAQWVGVMARRASLRQDGLDARLEECGQVMELVGLPWGTVWCGGARAELALGDGRVEAARALVDAALQFAAAHEFARYGVMRCRLTRARILRAADQDGAEADVHQSLAISSAGGLRIESIEGLELLATFALERGDAEEAARLLGAAGAAREETGAPVPPIARAELDAARADAAVALGEARFAEVIDDGARLELADAIAYAARGRGARGRPATGWRSLTPAEVQVVELVAEGCKNAEIAERLFVSVSTVKTHLAHIFDKLAVSTRAELAAQAARRA